MKKYSISLLTALLMTAVSWGQDIIYLANGNQLENVQLIEIADKKVYFLERKGDEEFKRAFKRSGIAIIFRKDGRYLLMADLDKNSEVAQKQLEEYLNAPARAVSSDIIIKAKPLKVIVGNISYESDDVFNYETTESEAASINKKEVSVVFYKDGSHQILRDPEDVSESLFKARKDLEKVEESIVKIDAPPAEPDPVAKPEPVAVVPEPVTADPAAVIVEPVAEPVPPVAVAKTTKGKKGSRSKTKTAMPSLNEEDQQAYRQKGIDKVKEFEAYLNIITNKAGDPDEKDKAIEEAAKLFIPGSTIEVTSLNRAGVSKYDIKDYLTRLKMLPYSSAKLEWANVGYVKELKQETDGNYYGTITGEQTFIGLSEAGEPMYSDVTKKNVKVRVSSYQKQIEGAEQLQWELLLGSIGIETGN